jgi:hypothetical protein
MSEGLDLGIGQTGKERDNAVHEILVINYGVLALLHKDLHKITEVVAEFLPCLPCHDEWVFTTFLKYIKNDNNFPITAMLTLSE